MLWHVLYAIYYVLCIIYVYWVYGLCIIYVYWADGVVVSMFDFHRSDRGSNPGVTGKKYSPKYVLPSTYFLDNNYSPVHIS